MWTWDQTNISFDNPAVFFDGSITPVMAVLQSANGAFPANHPGNTALVTLPGVTGGSAIVVVSFGLSKVAGATSISVNDGNAYSSLAFVEAGTPQWAFVDISVLLNAGAGTHNIVSTNSAGSNASYGYAVAMEVSNVVTASPVDTSHTASDASSTTSPATGNTASIANPFEIAVAAFCYRSSGTQALTEPNFYANVFKNTNGFTQQSIGSVDTIYPVAGVQSASWGSFTGSNWASAIVVLKGQVAGPITTPPGPIIQNRRRVSTVYYPN